MSWNSFWSDVGDFFSDLKNKTSFGWSTDNGWQTGEDWTNYYNDTFVEPIYDSLGIGKGTQAREQIDAPQIDLGSIKDTVNSFQEEGKQIKNNVTAQLGGLADGLTNAVDGLSNGIVGGDSNGSTWSKLGNWLTEVANSLTGVTAQQIAKENAQNALKMNDDNLAYQREALEYQKQLNNITMSRQDTAHQREVADMRSAGLSPYASMNGAGSNGLVGYSAPQNDINGVSSALNNMSGVYQSNHQNLVNNSLGMLSYIQNERVRLHQEDVDALKFGLDSYKTSLDKMKIDLQERMNIHTRDIERAQLELNQIQDKRSAEYHQKEMELLALNIKGKALENTQTQINNMSLDYDLSEKKDTREHRNALRGLEERKQEAQISSLITQASSTQLLTISKIKSESKGRELTEAEIDKIYQTLNLDKKIYKRDTVFKVLDSVLDFGKTAVDVAGKFIR